MSLKQIQTLLISLLIPFAIFAQDYQSFRSDRRYNYGYFFHVGFRSVTNNGNDSIFRTYDNIWKNDSLNCWNTIDGSFIGKQVIIKANGYDVFLNKHGDSVYVKRDARLNESWTLFQKDSLVFEARVMKHDTLSFLGITDSVKTIGIEVFDTAMNPVSHWIPTYKHRIMLSKNYGMIRAMGFRFFSDDIDEFFEPLGFQFGTSASLSLMGMSNPDIGMRDLKTFDIFDFQAGDELHVEERNYSQYSGAGGGRITRRIYQYLSRLDSLPFFIEYKVFVKMREIEYEDGAVMSDTFISKEATHTYKPIYDLDQPAFTSVGGRFYRLSVNGESKKQSLGMYSLFGGGSCTNPPISYHICDIAYEYRKGLGGPYYECGEYTYGIVEKHRILKYFKKADTTWGTPFTDVGFEEYSTKDLKLFPNPSNNQLYISLTNKKALENAQIEIYDLSGRLLQIQEGENTSHNSTYLIDVSELSPGSYLLRVITSAESLVGRFEVRDDLE